MVCSNPLLATEQVYRKVGDNYSFLGTGFGYHTTSHIITAAHCVDGAEASEIAIIGQGRPYIRNVDKILIHPEADLAILYASAPRDDHNHFFPYILGINGLGEDVHAYGAPLMKRTDQPKVPDFRLFKGHVQRFYQHVSHMKSPTTNKNYTYGACELSIPCPSGLSGGPVFRVPFALLLGMVTENYEVSTRVDTFEEVADDGKHFRSETARIVEFGTFLRLDTVKEWIDQHVPPVPPVPTLPTPTSSATPTHIRSSNRMRSETPTGPLVPAPDPDQPR